MPKLAILIGVLLIALAVAFYLATGSHAPTALIPAIFGALLVLCGAMANTTVSGRRKLWMHIGVTVSLLGFLATAKSIYDEARLLQGVTLARPAAVEEKCIMSLLCFIFTLLCVWSFVAARRARA